MMISINPFSTPPEEAERFNTYGAALVASVENGNAKCACCNDTLQKMLSKAGFPVLKFSPKPMHDNNLRIRPLYSNKEICEFFSDFVLDVNGALFFAIVLKCLYYEYRKESVHIDVVIFNILQYLPVDTYEIVRAEIDKKLPGIEDFLYLQSGIEKLEEEHRANIANMKGNCK